MVPARQRFVYVSRASDGVSASAVAKLAADAAERNRRRGITGMLLFSGSHFAQVLEGPEPELQALTATILADPRHHGVAVVHWGEAPHPPQFAAWSCGYLHDAGAGKLLETLAQVSSANADDAHLLVQHLLPRGDG